MGEIMGPSEMAIDLRDYYRQYNREYHDKHRDYFRAKRKAAALAKRRLINDLKSKPCVDCDVKFSPWVMQFDHRDPSLKSFNLGNAESRTLAQIHAEAGKCDVVCANCHAERTYLRRPKRVDL